MDVTSTNFESVYNDFESHIEKATFVSFDTEFTGLSPYDHEIESIRSSINDEYTVYKAKTEDNILLQIGFCLFQYDENNHFTARPYNFNLFPQAIKELRSSDFKNLDVFCCQMASIAFLAKYNMDFNKCFQSGIPYINDQQLNAVKSSLGNRYLYQDLLNEVRKFASDANVECQSLWLPRDRTASIVAWCLSKRFPQISFNVSSDQTLTMNKKQPSNIEVDNFDCTEIVEKYKTPLVGHNCLMDILLIFQHLCKPLPDKCDQFIPQTHEMFNLFWDTKHIVKCLKNQIADTFVKCPTGLQWLYEHLNSMANDKALFSTITIPTQFDRYSVKSSTKDLIPTIKKECFHEAGFDAWMTGVALIRMAELVRKQKTLPKNDSFEYRYLPYIRQFNNFINVISGPVAHLYFNDRPPFFTKEIPIFEFVLKSKQDNSMLQSLLRSVDQCSLTNDNLIRVRSNYGRLAVERLLNESSINYHLLANSNRVIAYVRRNRSVSFVVGSAGVLAICCLMGVGMRMVKLSR